jgi:hypothetical protein
MKSVRIIALLWSAMMLTGCITFKYPKGDWVYPVDLRLEAGVLANAVVGVRCGYGEPDESDWSQSVMEGCTQTARAVRSLGATVVADQAIFPAVALKQAEKIREANAENIADGTATEQNLEETGYVDEKTTKLVPELTVVYIDRGTEKNRCIFRSLLFIVTYTLYPCPVEVITQAEIRVYDQKNILAFQQDLRMDMNVIHGIPALFYLVMRWINVNDYKLERDTRADNLFQFIQNTVHAQHLRVRTAQISGVTNG